MCANAHFFERVKTIDRIRGVCIIYMIFAHSWQWIPQQDSWFFWVTYPFTDLIGACMFTFVAGASLALSVRAKPNAPAKGQHLRSLLILGFGIAYNSIGYPVGDEWMWTILTTIAVSRLVGYYCLKLPPWVRCVLIGVIIYGTRPLLLSIYNVNVFTTGGITNLFSLITDPKTLAGYILFNGAEDTFLPYFAFFLTGTIFVDLFVLQSEDRRKVHEPFLIFAGAALALTGILLGLVPTNIDQGDLILHYINISGRNTTTFPTIYSRGSYQWCMLAVGSMLLIAVIFFHFEHYSLRSKVLTIFGQYSLTIYITHNVIFFAFPHNLPLWGWFPIMVGYICLHWSAYTYWDRKAQGKFSIEDLIRMVMHYYSVKWALSEQKPPGAVVPVENLAGEGARSKILADDPKAEHSQAENDRS